MGVKKDFRNKSIGNCLLYALLLLTKAAAYEPVELNVIADNLPGEAHGFEDSPMSTNIPDGSYGDYLCMVWYL